MGLVKDLLAQARKTGKVFGSTAEKVIPVLNLAMYFNSVYQPMFVEHRFRNKSLPMGECEQREPVMSTDHVSSLALGMDHQYYEGHAYIWSEAFELLIW